MLKRKKSVKTKAKEVVTEVLHNVDTTRPSPEFKRFRRRVRSYGKCTCKTPKGALRLEAIDDSPELQYSISNNVVVCSKCSK